jgi:hypothetical protein
VAACDMTIKDNVLKMMLSHPPRGTKSKSKIVENDKILKKNEIEPKIIFIFLFL